VANASSSATNKKQGKAVSRKADYDGDQHASKVIKDKVRSTSSTFVLGAHTSNVNPKAILLALSDFSKDFHTAAASSSRLSALLHVLEELKIIGEGGLAAFNELRDLHPIEAKNWINSFSDVARNVSSVRMSSKRVCDDAFGVFIVFNY
jgi:threonine/homoserine/homoserine lactone efflux protein